MERCILFFCEEVTKNREFTNICSDVGWTGCCTTALTKYDKNVTLKKVMSF